MWLCCLKCKSIKKYAAVQGNSSPQACIDFICMGIDLSCTLAIMLTLQFVKVPVVHRPGIHTKQCCMIVSLTYMSYYQL